jgi:bifunctional non-homologous end joining protein LigD
VSDLRLLPMLAMPGTLSDVAGDAWAHEFKWDGVRALVVGDGQRVQLRSRVGNDVTAGYPELADLATVLPAGTVVDGEVVALGADGAPSFPLLQRRMHVRDPGRVAAVARRVPVVLMAFDVLVHAGTSVMERSWEDRREVLESLGLSGPAWATPPVGADLGVTLRTAAERGLEGVVSKRRASPYRPGERSPDWRKLRLVHEQEVVVGGIRHGRGHRTGTFGALLVGTWDDTGTPDRPLRYAGGVGSGFSDRETRRLQALLAPLVTSQCPFVDPPRDRDVSWVRPELVVQVRYREWTPEGRLRQPSYRGQRVDRDPATVRREPGVVHPPDGRRDA